MFIKFSSFQFNSHHGHTEIVNIFEFFNYFNLDFLSYFLESVIVCFVLLCAMGDGTLVVGKQAVSSQVMDGKLTDSQKVSIMTSSRNI